MTTRHRTTSNPRKEYGLWRPSDGSDSDRPRQTMATTQRHNVDQTPVVEAPRKHRSSRRPDPTEVLDPSAAYSRHKSSSKDRSTANHASYYIVPPSPNPSVQHQTNTAHYDLRAYLKQKTEKRNPGTSNEKGVAAEEAKPPRSGQRSRLAYPDPATYNAAVAAAQSYSTPTAQATRDPTSASRHHRERDKDREKPTTRDPERVRARDLTTERSEDRERRRRKEKEEEKERPSKDRERAKEKERRKDRQGRAAAEARPVDAASVYQAYAQPAAVAQRLTEKAAAPYPDIVRPPSTQPQAAAHVPPADLSSTPWTGLTSAGRGAAASVPESVYPYASDKDDPPLPIPPPTRRRTSSKPHRSHKATSQQAGQDSGLSSSEQEHERPRATDRHYASREQASLLQRGYSSGPSGSENEKAPTIQMERVRKHRTHGESSRHKSKTANVDAQPAIEPTTSQEIATQWYQRHQRDPSSSKTPAPTSADPSAQKSSNGLPASALSAHTTVPSSGKPTTSVGLTVSQRAPQIVSIRAGQGPADPHAPLPKVIHSGVTPLRQPDPLPSQQYHPATSRQQDASLQALSQGHATTYAEASSSHPHFSVTQGVSGSYQQSGQSYPNTMHTRPSFETNGVPSAALHGNQLAMPDVVVRPPSTRPPSTAPVSSDPYSRARTTSASPGQSAAYAQLQVQTLGEADAYRSGGTHARGPSQDLPSRFPVYEDATGASRPSAPSAPHIPSASPKRGLTYPGASAPPHTSAAHINPPNYGNGTYDPRSPKPPSVQTITNDPSRLQTYLSGSPAGVPKTVSAGSSTPKHSPSVRLQSHRNGSNDTITHAAVTKSSPSGSSQQHLPHRPSAVNIQPQLHAFSRLDAGTSSRQPNASSAYPDITRYRSPAPQAQGYPNAYASSSAPINSPSYSTQTPLATNDYQQYGRAAATPTQGTFAAQQGQASSVQVQPRSRQSVDYGHRPPEQILVTNPLASPAHSAQRIPPRAAPSPAPTGRPARLLSSLSSKVSAPVHSAPPRSQTFPTPGPSYSTTTPYPTAHSRTASDPHRMERARDGYTPYPSASLPIRGRQAASQQQQDILLTPSSLAPSMLPQTSAPLIPLDRSTSKNTLNEKEKEKEKKRSFFGNLFRSRSSPPKQRDEPPPPPSQQVRERRERNNSQPTQPIAYVQAPPITNGASRSAGGPPPPSPRRVPVPSMSMPAPAPAAAPTHQRGYSTSAVPNVAPIAQPAPVSLTRNASGKMFTPFRLLSKRHRTVSTASVDAVDGTVINAMLTGGDSTRSSTAGRPSPPLRDPMTAAQEWRNQEEVVQQTRGTLRRRRPGVTFDVGEEVPEDGRPSLQKTLRANLAAMAAAQGQVPAQVQAQVQGQQQQQPQQQQPQPPAVQAHQTYQTQATQHQGYPAQAQYSQGQPLRTRQATA